LTVEDTEGLTNSTWKLVEVGRHDVAVVEVNASHSWVYQGQKVNVTVTLANNGEFAETVNVTLCYDITANKMICSRMIALEPSENKTLSFTWDTKDVPYCYNYTMTAVAVVAIDTVPADNVLSGGDVEIRIMGDANGDKTANMVDLRLVSRNFGLSQRELGWNPDLDLNLDGYTNMIDMYLTAASFGKTRP
jgi:hypothetical protein